MPKVFNYRSPNCGSANDGAIHVYFPVWLCNDQILKMHRNVRGPDDWLSTDPASCGKCHYSGTAADFAPQGANVIRLRRNPR
jgi:hypothetical protein